MSRQPTRIVITGGGTGGHLSPAVAVIEALQDRAPKGEVQLYFIGSHAGAEARVIPVMGIRYKAVSVGKLRRYFSLSNAVDALRVPLGVAQSLGYLLRVRPHAVLATGGYVSVPPVIAAAVLRRPILLHEQTGSLGLANRINARFSTKIALSVPGSERGLQRSNWVLTGNPVRSAVRSGSTESAARRFGLDAAAPTIYITGGAQGSHVINRTVLGALPSLLSSAQVIHQCGDAPGTREDYERLLGAAMDLPQSLQNRYVLMRYVGPEIGDVYAISDLVVGRAGAGTVSEVAALGKPALFIPLPHAAGDEQRENARRMEEIGAAVVLDEVELTPERLAREVASLLEDRTRLAAMAQASHSTGLGDAAAHLADLVLELARQAS